MTESEKHMALPSCMQTDFDPTSKVNPFLATNIQNSCNSVRQSAVRIVFRPEEVNTRDLKKPPSFDWITEQIGTSCNINDW